jgi:hypothetical protein
MSDENVFRSVDPETGVAREVELTEEQARRLAAGENATWTVRDEQILVDDDGTITERESGKPLLEE